MKLSIYSTILAAAMVNTAYATPVADAAAAAAAPSDLGYVDPPTGVVFANITARDAGDVLTKRATGTFQAFSGNFCDGAAGGVIPIEVNGKCIGTPGRHSFRMTCRGAVYFYEGPNCSKYTTASIYNPGCYNVNTGRDWQSALVACER